VEETGYKTEAEQDGKGGYGFIDGHLIQNHPQFIWSGDLGFPQADDHPVLNVSWNDATAFCQWLSKKQNAGYGLPTEAQWEYACRAGTTTLWHCEDSDTTLQEHAWFVGNADGKTHPVGQLKPNAWGLYDMHGNVWEWCEDWYGPDYYAQSLLRDPSGPTTGSSRVCRGGCYLISARRCRSANRYHCSPNARSFNFGFRVASVLSSKPTDQDVSAEGAKASKNDNLPGRKDHIAKVTQPKQKPPTLPVKETLSEPPLAVAPFDAEAAKQYQQAWANYLNIPVEVTNSIRMKLKLIPAGEFLMGSPESDRKAIDSEKPQHRVRITKPFCLGVTEVTQGQWEAVMGTRPWSGKSHVREGSDYAASYVSWEDAVEFCRKLSSLEGKRYRLPTEAEWEYACRAGTTTVFHFDRNASPLGEYAWYENNAYEVGEAYVHRVGQKRASPFGLYDMHGNVHEWCADWYGEDYYRDSPTDDPTGPSSGSHRVYHGGVWHHTWWRCRSAYRAKASPDDRSSHVGFRVVLVLSETDPTRERESTAKVELSERKPKPSPTRQTHAEPPLAIAPFDAEAAKQHQQAWADYLNIPVQVTNSIGMKLVLIPPGEFMMGTAKPESRYEHPQHRVCITKPFYLGVNEVTQAEYRRVMGMNPSEFDGTTRPAENITWNDAVAFCSGLTGLSQTRMAGRVYRLPTEAEWEYACRAGTTTLFYWGDSDSDRVVKEYCWYEKNAEESEWSKPHASSNGTQPVGQKRANAWGLNDMSGNVYEWCHDRWGTDYPTGSYRVLRGGSWRYDARYCRSAFRYGNSPGSRFSSFGFRVVSLPVDVSGKWSR